ncbi:universal stress protein [Sphingomonas oligophenolica]|uniref:Universal stress protein n=1 Tax=Sphingomonas oligophenolica TaxID=301154 RepID=A0ABU9Y7L6_9SPHN
MKNILLLVHDDAGQEARFQAALDLGRALEGHLVCLDVTILPALVGADYVGDAGFSMLLKDERDREATNRTKLEGRLAHEDVPWEWKEATGTLAPCLSDAAELADVIVVNRQLDDFPLPDMRTVAGELVVGSGKPILAVPDCLKRLDLDTALVAWDGSPSSAAALRAAVPLLRLATRVTIVEIEDDSIQAPAEEAATYLSRHDIHPEIRRLPAGDKGAAEMILGQLADDGFGYLVMGGFGHRRFAEALFGGVTRAMLTKCPVPVFLAHEG